MKGRLTAEPQLIPGDPWELRLEYDVYEGSFGLYGEPSGHTIQTFPLNSSHPHKALPYGRYAMEVYVGPDDQGPGEWVFIAFYPPDQWRYDS